MSIFQSLGGVKYLDGGVESGFRHVDPDAYNDTLYHVKGKRDVRVKQVKMEAGSMNAGDVFILDTNKTVFLWSGGGANRLERAKGMEIANSLRQTNHGGAAEVVCMDQGDESAEFWTALGGEGAVAPETDDDAAEAAAKAATKLFHISDATGALVVSEIAERPLTKDHLKTEDTFLLDCGDEIFVWTGRGCTQDEKKKAMIMASQYLVDSGRPNWIPITKIFEVHYPTYFSLSISLSVCLNTRTALSLSFSLSLCSP